MSYTTFIPTIVSLVLALTQRLPFFFFMAPRWFQDYHFSFFMALFWARSRVLDGKDRGVAMCNANAAASGHKAIVLL